MSTKSIRKKTTKTKSRGATSGKRSVSEKRTMSMYRRQVRGGGIMPSVPGLNFRDTQYRQDGGVKNSARFVVNIAVDGRVKVWSWSVPVHGPVESLQAACKHLAKLRKAQYHKFPDSANVMMENAIADFLNSGRRGYSANKMSKEFRETRKALAALR
jgi:hypothetical protein